MFYLPFIVCGLGALIYLIAKDYADLKELARISFFAGALVSLLVLAGWKG